MMGVVRVVATESEWVSSCKAAGQLPDQVGGTGLETNSSTILRVTLRQSYTRSRLQAGDPG